MNNLWCTNYSSVPTNTRFTVLTILDAKGLDEHVTKTLEP